MVHKLLIPNSFHNAPKYEYTQKMTRLLENIILLVLNIDYPVLLKLGTLLFTHTCKLTKLVKIFKATNAANAAAAHSCKQGTC